jgi:hypothetical protein
MLFLPFIFAYTAQEWLCRVEYQAKKKRRKFARF